MNTSTSTSTSTATNSSTGNSANSRAIVGAIIRINESAAARAAARAVVGFRVTSVRALRRDQAHTRARTQHMLTLVAALGTQVA